jgi:hypothetical protein
LEGQEPVASPCRIAVSRPQGFWHDCSVWKGASSNTFNCLIGYSIGDIGVVIYRQACHPDGLEALLAILPRTDFLPQRAARTATMAVREQNTSGQPPLKSCSASRENAGAIWPGACCAKRVLV